MAKRKITEALEEIHKKHGDGATVRLVGPVLSHQGFSTGSVGLDRAICGAGFPVGRITEIYGVESSGKTTICLEGVASCQRAGKTAVLIDAEHALDLAWAEKIGVNLGKLILAQPSSGEEALDIAERLIAVPEVGLVVIDSVAALVPQVELDGEFGDTAVGAQARMMSQAMRKLRGAIHASQAAVVFTNQIRHKIGVMYGTPETTAGGLALKFYADVRIDLRRVSQTLEKMQTRSKVRAKVVKNKLSPPFQVVEFDIVPSGGVDKLLELISVAEQREVLVRRGAWYWLEETRLANGKDKLLDCLQSDPDLVDKIRALVKC